MDSHKKIFLSALFGSAIVVSCVLIFAKTGQESIEDRRARSVVSVSDTELKELTEALRGVDNNAPKPGNVVINPQYDVSGLQTSQDMSPHSLVTNVSNVVLSTDINSRLLEILGSYNLKIGQPEVFTTSRDQLENAFLNLVLKTPVWTKVYEFMRGKGSINSKKELKAWLKATWFGMYSRSKGKALDSSGFEHVFSGELRADKPEVTGMHSFMRYAQLEKTDNIDYYGYTKHFTQQPLTICARYSLNGHIRWCSSMLYDTSPELELALYSLCFMYRQNKVCRCRMASRSVNIQTWTWTYGGQEFVASAYVMV